MSTARGTPVYDTLVIVARFPDTERWRGDDGGHPGAPRGRGTQDPSSARRLCGGVWAGECRVSKPPRPGESIHPNRTGSWAPGFTADATVAAGRGKCPGRGPCFWGLGDWCPCSPNQRVSRRPPASARASLQLSGAAHPPRSSLYTSQTFLLDQLFMLNETDGRWPIVGAINQALRMSSPRLIRDVYNDEPSALGGGLNIRVVDRLD
jgi:hypothetical protein